MRAQASVPPGTLDAEQDAVRGAAPACLWLAAVHAHAARCPMPNMQHPTGRRGKIKIRNAAG